MPGKLFIGNLPSTATKTDLESKFSQFGRVLSAEVLTDAATGRSKRSGHVEMESVDQAQAAINRLHRSQYDDMVIFVKRC